jgi:RHS repeat-associated protein
MRKHIFHKACLFAASVIAAAVFTAALSSAALAQPSCGPSGTGNPIQEKASCNAEQPASQTNANEPSPGGGNPINIITGNKYQQEVDLAALPGELGIEVVRHYNSLATSDSGHVGRGWRLSYETEIRFEGTNLTLIQADGKRYQFKCDAVLCRTQDWADGVVLIRTAADTNIKSYVWRWLAGNASRRELTFDDRGLLLNIRAANGSILTIQRFKDGRIQEVVDPQGRKLVFQYPSAAQLNAQPSRFDGVMAIDTPLGRVEYGHGSAVPLGVALDAVTTVRGHRINTAFLQRQSNLVFAQMTGVEFRDLGSAKKHYFYESVFEGQHAYLTGISINGIRQSTYLYDKSGLAVLSTKGEPARLVVDASGAVLLPKRLVENTGVEQIVVLRKTQGQAVLVNSLGLETTYKYRVIGGQYRLLEVRGPGCSTCGLSNQRYEYSQLGLLARQITLDTNGVAIQIKEFSRDSFGRIIAVKADANMLSSNTYEADMKDVAGVALPLFEVASMSVPSVVPDKWATRSFERNAFGQVVSMTVRGWDPLNPEPVITTSSYRYENIAGRSMLVGMNVLGSSTTVRWDDKANRIASMIMNDRSTTTYRQDEAGRVIETVRFVGERAVQTELKYLALRVESKQTSAWFINNEKPYQTSLIALNPQIYKYDRFGQLVETVDVVGRSKYFAYDHFGRLVSESDAAGYGANLRMDTEGNIQRSAATYKDTVVRANYAWHDDYGRVIRALQPDGRIDDWQFDAQGRVASHFNSDNVQHRFSRGKTDASRYLQISEALDGETRFSTNLVASVEKKFDDLGRLVFQSSKDHGSAKFFYDEIGRLKEKVRSDGVTERFMYDESGSVARHSWIDTQGDVLDESSFQYKNGVLFSVINGAQETNYEHDALGRTTAEHIRLQGLDKPKVFTTKTDYDPRSSLVLSRTLFDGRVLQTIYTEIAQGAYPVELRLDGKWASRFKSLVGKRTVSAIDAIIPTTRIASGIKVSPLNGLEAFELGNGLTVNRVFDAAGRLTELNNVGVGRSTYKYDTGPRVRSIEETDSQQSTQQAMQRVTFSYSSFGFLNSTFVALDDQKNSAQHIPNKHSFNVQNQLKEIRNGMTSAPIANYSYNASRQRVRKVVLGEPSKAKERFYLWQTNKVAAEVDTDGNIVSQYVYLNDGAKAQPIAQLNGSEIFYIHNEHRGAPAAMTDTHKNIVWKANSNSTGLTKVIQAASGIELNLRLPGQYFDAESNLHDNFHRTYNPATGRYLQADPLGYPDGPDTYLYASGDPINRVDPLGLYDIDVHYYMTFFLARVAGVSSKQSAVIALAAQYVDDNPMTRPETKLNLTARQWYHFVLSGFGESSDVNTRFLDPKSAQLDALYEPQNYKFLSACQRSQFFGEYLHTLADTFSHRDESNAPYGHKIGHSSANHDADETFNVRDFKHNELRTIAMEERVFNAIKTRYQTQGLDSTGFPLEFSDIKDSLVQFNLIGKEAANSAPKWQDVNSEPAYKNRRAIEVATKVNFLRAALAKLGLGSIPDYSSSQAAANRSDFLGKIRRGANPEAPSTAFSGILLPADDCPVGSVQIGCKN